MSARRRQKSKISAPQVHIKADYQPMTDEQKLMAVSEFSDDVLSKLTHAFFEVLQKEKWGKRDIANICGLNESAVNHILAGRRLNPTIETVALLSRAMRRKPELILHDSRPMGNYANADDSGTTACVVVTAVNRPTLNAEILMNMHDPGKIYSNKASASKPSFEFKSIIEEAAR